jgi:membrane-bound serine protease (ClpP class)
MIGAEGECLENDGKHLTVYVHSERWNASSSFPIKPGQRVRVTGITGLILSVEPTTNNLNLNNQHP